MKVRLLVVFLALGGLSSFGAHSTASDPAARRGPLPRYRATLLRPLPRHQASLANAINEAGAAVGRSRSTAIDSDQATLWDASGNPILLPSDRNINEAYAINDVGEIAGTAAMAGDFSHACVWKNGVQHYLPEFPNAKASHAWGINNDGWIVGSCGNGKPSPPFFEDTHAVLWLDDEIIDLGVLGGSSSAATAVNDAGQIVGVVSLPWGQEVGFIWESGRMSRLPTPRRYHGARAEDINEDGLIVGTSYQEETDKVRLTFWKAGKARVAPFSAVVPSVNNAGTVVSGEFRDPDPPRAYVWRKGRREWLTRRLAPRPENAEWAGTEATDINHRGQIVGAKWRLGGPPTAFRLDPAAR